jgi:hypothetical protein
MKTAALVLLLALPAVCDVKPGDTAPALHAQAFVRSEPVDAAITSFNSSEEPGRICSGEQAVSASLRPAAADHDLARPAPGSRPAPGKSGSIWFADCHWVALRSNIDQSETL